MDQIAAGIQLEDGEIHADAISYTDDFKKDQVGIEIHSGKNRIVRRIFESLGYKVVKLDRVFFAGLTKKGLRRGDWRYLSEAEVTTSAWVRLSNKSINNNLTEDGERKQERIHLAFETSSSCI